MPRNYGILPRKSLKAPPDSRRTLRQLPTLRRRLSYRIGHASERVFQSVKNRLCEAQRLAAKFIAVNVRKVFHADQPKSAPFTKPANGGGNV